MKMKKHTLLALSLIMAPSILLAGGKKVVRIGQKPARLKTMESTRTFKPEVEKKQVSAAQNKPKAQEKEKTKAEKENKELRALLKVLIIQQIQQNQKYGDHVPIEIPKKFMKNKKQRDKFLRQQILQRNVFTEPTVLL